MPGADAAQGQKLCEDLRRKLGQLGFHFGGKPVKITASVGLSEFRVEDTPDSVFERADRALYVAKKNGRDRSVVE